MRYSFYVLLTGKSSMYIDTSRSEVVIPGSPPSNSAAQERNGKAVKVVGGRVEEGVRWADSQDDDDYRKRDGGEGLPKQDSWLEEWDGGEGGKRGKLDRTKFGSIVKTFGRFYCTP